jgi:hypothetical protein
MAVGRDVLLREYQTRLSYWRDELERVDPGETARAEQIRSFIAHYEAQVGTAEHPSNTQDRNEIGAGPTLGGDRKPNIDC